MSPTSNKSWMMMKRNANDKFASSKFYDLFLFYMCLSWTLLTLLQKTRSHFLHTNTSVFQVYSTRKKSYFILCSNPNQLSHWINKYWFTRELGSKKLFNGISELESMRQKMRNLMGMKIFIFSKEGEVRIWGEKRNSRKFVFRI